MPRMTEPQDPFAPAPGPQPPALPYGTPPPPYGAPAPYGAPVEGGRRNGLGTAALVLGIIAIIPCSYLLLIPAVLALVFGLIGRRRVKRQQATNGGAALTGVILGGLALIPGIALWAIVASNVPAIQRYSDCTKAAGSDQVAKNACTRRAAHDIFGIDLSSSS
jgi:hypothetical protein